MYLCIKEAKTRQSHNPSASRLLQTCVSGVKWGLSWLSILETQLGRWDLVIVFANHLFQFLCFTLKVLTRENIEAVVRFAQKEKLFIFADEVNTANFFVKIENWSLAKSKNLYPSLFQVYQHNVYAEGSKFHSFKKVCFCGNWIQLILEDRYLKISGDRRDGWALLWDGGCQLHVLQQGLHGGVWNEVSWGLYVEVHQGVIRGGYAEVVNMDDDVMALLQKSISAKLCPTVLGQSCMDIVANPPKPGEPSYDSWLQEKEVSLFIFC